MRVARATPSIADEREPAATPSPSCMAREKVVGWFQGRMEFGPRALGARSIIGDARSAAMQSVMNLKIKFRESFRPFAPVVLQERVSRLLRDARRTTDSPYMLLVAPVQHERRTAPQRRAAARASTS